MSEGAIYLFIKKNLKEVMRIFFKAFLGKSFGKEDPKKSIEKAFQVIVAHLA